MSKRRAFGEIVSKQNETVMGQLRELISGVRLVQDNTGLIESRMGRVAEILTNLAHIVKSNDVRVGNLEQAYTAGVADMSRKLVIVGEDIRGHEAKISMMNMTVSEIVRIHKEAKKARKRRSK